MADSGLNGLAMATMDLPRVFVASSSERRGDAEFICRRLEESRACTVEPWTEIFRHSATYIESLENQLDRADFAVFVLTADDPATMRGGRVNLPRDNVLFELGLFVGRLGRDRCFFFLDDAARTKLPSDLLAVKEVIFPPTGRSRAAESPENKSREKAVSEVLNRIREDATAALRYKPSKDARNAQERLWRFSCRLVGEWWERIKRGDDNESALSYVKIALDDSMNTLSIRGDSYGLKGQHMANWETRATSIVLGPRPIVYYLWKGERESQEEQGFSGAGQITIEDENLDELSGYFVSTNVAQLPTFQTTIKRFRLSRCRRAEGAIMRSPSSSEARLLIEKKLETLDWP
jgi:predicted nucleotide-binding protein